MSTMYPQEWLNNKALGFEKLTEQEVSAILYFTILWSLFEKKALHTNASSNKILALVHEWSAQNQLYVDKFESSIDYFKNRYFNGGRFSRFFSDLNLRRNDNRELVKSVLSGKIKNDADCVAVILIIVYRLRNNLFHGVKWADGISGQLDNFTNANNAIMAALETNGGI